MLDACSFSLLAESAAGSYVGGWKGLAGGVLRKCERGQSPRRPKLRGRQIEIAVERPADRDAVVADREGGGEKADERCTAVVIVLDLTSRGHCRGHLRRRNDLTEEPVLDPAVVQPVKFSAAPELRRVREDFV